MAVEVVKSVLLTGKLGERLTRAFNEAKNAELKESGFGGLPEGLTAICQLKECRFRVIADGKDGAGEKYLYATGRVVSPKTFTDKRGNVHIVEGEITTLMEVLYDTPDRSRKTVEQHFAHIIGHMKALLKFVPNGKKMLNSVQDVEKVAQFLTQLKPHFKIKTFKGEPAKTGKYKDKEPRVQEMWQGAVQYRPEVNLAARTQDDTEITDEQPLPDEKGTAPAAAQQGHGTTSRTGRAFVQVPGAAAAHQARPAPANGAQGQPAAAAATRAVPAPAKATVVRKAPPAPAPAPEPEPEPAQEPFSEFDDLPSLVERAASMDQDAQVKLAELAIAQGYTKEEVESTQDWDTLGQMASHAKPDGEPEPDEQELGHEGEGQEEQPDEPEEESQEPTFPAVEMVCQYKPYNPKTKKYEQNAVECVIKGINTDKQTADLLNLADGKTVYKGAKLDKLMPME